MKVIQTICIISLLLFTFSACRKDKTPEPNDGFNCTYGTNFKFIYDTRKKSDGLVPLSFYNYWVYADTLWEADGSIISTGLDTAYSGHLRKTNGDLWWYVDGPSPMGSVHLADNKIYSLDYNYGGCFSKSLKYYEATADTINDGITINGDIAIARKVYKSGTTINTPAGDFDDCTVFDIEFSSAYQILKPGIGFVKYALDGYNGGYKEYTLIDYHLE